MNTRIRKERKPTPGARGLGTRPMEGRRVLLTPLQMEHIDTHFLWNNDEALNRLDSEAPFVQEPFGSFYRRFEALVYQPQPDARDLEIHTRDGTLIGVAFIDRIDEGNRHGRISISIGDPAYRNQGLGRDALETLLHYLFDTLGFHRVTAEAFAYNEAWQHLLTSTGFQAEGCLNDYLFRDGKYWGKMIYAMLNTDYAARVRRKRRLKTVPTNL